MIISRLGTTNDISKILDLQSKYLVSNMTEEQKRDGFITTPFTETLILNQDYAIDNLLRLEIAAKYIVSLSFLLTP